MVTPRDDTSIGMFLMIASAAAYSTAGLFTHLIALDTWTVLFWRGLFAGGFLAACIAWLYRGRIWATVRSIGWAGLLAAACSTAATICFINALRLSSVADVMVIGATTPFVTAALVWVWTGDRERRATLAASVVALAGVALMFQARMTAGHMLGNLLAIAMTILLAAMMVIVRHKRDTPMLPASCLSAFAVAPAVLVIDSPSMPAGMDLVYLILFGTTQFGVGLLLLTLGTRLISATRAALISALDTPLAPVWVWLAFGEMPQLMTCVGGAIVMLAVIGDMLWSRQGGPVGRTKVRAMVSSCVGTVRPRSCSLRE